MSESEAPRVPEFERPVDPPLSREAVREIDRRATAEFHVPSLLLMENAGRGAAQIGARILMGRRTVGEAKLIHEGKIVRRSYEELSGLGVLVMAGVGNNAGDGFVVARHLYNAGADVLVALLSPRASFDAASDAGLNLKIIGQMGVLIREVAEPADLRAMESVIHNADLVVDALFGTGLSREIAEPFATAIEMINECGKLGRRILALDVPSGIDAETGQIWGSAVMAHDTATFAAVKNGLLVGEGPAHAGDIHLVDIGAPRELLVQAHVRASKRKS